MSSRNMYDILLVVAIQLLDRATKHAALIWLPQSFTVTSFLDLTLVINRGISWGFFNTNNMFFVIITRTCIIALIMLLYAYMVVRYQQGKSIYAPAAIFSGAVSNLIDRFVYGGVIDFIHLHYNGWSWPVFNIADIAIVCGVLWMILHADTYDA